MKKHLICLFGALLLSGCAAMNRMEITYAPHTTFGRELMDLEEARKTGALTDEEYNRLKKTVMKLADGLCEEDDK